jgi:transposase-like protein
VFEECRLPIDKCLIAIWLEVNAKNSISSCEVARTLGVTQKTAWFLLHRIRHALHTGSFDMPKGGIVEADETYVGGLAKNMYKSRRAKIIAGTIGENKTAVMGLLARHDGTKCSQVHARVIPNAEGKTLNEVIRSKVEPGATIYTDAWQGYRLLDPAYGSSARSWHFW